MNIFCEELAGSVYKITLEGRMDIEGSQKIDIPLSGMAASPRKYIILDISKVTFLASIGIRLLLVTAKAVKSRGGKLVLLNPDQNISKVLDASGLLPLIPATYTLEEAVSTMLGQAATE